MANTALLSSLQIKSLLTKNSSAMSSISEICYMSLVRSILEYAAIVWSAHLQYQMNHIEKVQRSAARFVTNDFCYSSSVSNMLTQLKWPLLQQRRNFLKLMFYKILYGLKSCRRIIYSYTIYNIHAWSQHVFCYSFCQNLHL